jgi:hypothetical protein
MVLHRPVEIAVIIGRFEFPARLGADEILGQPRVFDQINGEHIQPKYLIPMDITGKWWGF